MPNQFVFASCFLIFFGFRSCVLGNSVNNLVQRRIMLAPCNVLRIPEETNRCEVYNGK